MTQLHRHLFACAAALAVAVPAGLVVAQPSAAPANPYTVVETGRTFSRLQFAVDAIGGGFGTISIAPGRYGDCAIQADGDVVYAAAAPGQVVFDTMVCEGKAALVLRGRSATVQGVTFTNMRVADGNGAGIRLEKGNLAVSQSWFKDSEQGILTADFPAGTITVDKSTFTRLGRCDRGLSCAHSIYTGDYGALSVTRSRFEAGRGGHYVKSRAARVAVLNSSFDDSAGRMTNYMIDLSTGATGRIAGNWFLQGQDKDNYSAFIAVSAEGKSHSAEGLTIEANDARLAPGLDRKSAFVADWSGDRLTLGANTLADGLTRYERR